MIGRTALHYIVSIDRTDNDFNILFLNKRLKFAY